jgi:hypothetical protein
MLPLTSRCYHPAWYWRTRLYGTKSVDELAADLLWMILNSSGVLGEPPTDNS